MEYDDDEICVGGPANWIVTSVEAKEDYTLVLTFIDGKRKVYNALPLLEIPIYAALKNLDFFLSAKVFCGSVAWSDNIDIAPEHLYECSVEI